MDAERRTYKAVAEDLRERVQNLRIPNGSFLPTERELQEEFGVSRTTVRRALAWLAENGHVEPIPNRGVVARLVAPKATKTVAFLDGSLTVLRGLYRTLSTEFLRRGYELIHIDTQSLGLETALHYARERNCAGAFIWSFEGYPNLQDLHAAAEHMPIIVLDHELRGFKSDLVTFDYFEMAREATGAMAKAGRKRIAISGMIDMLDVTQERMAGYMRGLFENNLLPHAKDFVFCLTSGTYVPDTTLLERRLQDADRPDAVFVTQDEFAPSVVQAIVKSGLRVPEDVAVATIGEEVTLSINGRSLTTSAFDWEEFASLALSLMLERLSMPGGPKVRRVARHELKVRGTCGSSSSATDSSSPSVDLITTNVHSRSHHPPMRSHPSLNEEELS